MNNFKCYSDALNVKYSKVHAQTVSQKGQNYDRIFGDH